MKLVVLDSLNARTDFLFVKYYNYPGYYYSKYTYSTVVAY